ncbi:MAG: MATE family efflux transporter [Candidatus Faecivicinus sp.]|nr:MATE family efflux transporter [Candidatus Faecivicinus sp.]
MVNDMTTGNSARKIFFFSLPLLIGTVFQQVYNLADSAIVGKILGTNPFAAVGLTGSITFFVLGLVFGSCSGFAIPVAQDFGAKNEAGVRRCVANIVWIGVVFAILMTVITVPLTKQILVWMDVPEELMGYAYDYLVWIFVGLGAQMMYNLLASIIRSLGDSKTPLYFLIVCSVLNIGLDIFCIRNLNMGVKGAAIATGVAQLISGVACLIYMVKKFPMLRLTRADMKLHLPTVKRLIGIGLPMGLQFSITAIGSIILQKSVNNLGTQIIASVSAASKVQTLVMSPMDAFGVSMATFTGQNYGARRLDRVRRATKEVTLMLWAYSVIAFCVFFFGSKFIVLMFVDPTETQIIQLVHQFVTINGAFYPVLSLIYVYRNTLQGVGYSKAAMLAGLFELIARTLMGLFIVPKLGYTAVCFAHPFAWFMADLILIPLYIALLSDKKQHHALQGQM